MTRPLHPVLQITDVVKSFGTNRVLDHVGLTIPSGEVHGLLGENGSGKSTLIKILSGVYTPESGRLLVNGAEIPLPLDPERSRRAGMEFVHQDLGLIPTLSVAENLLLVEIAAGMERSWNLSRRRLESRARDILASLGVDLAPDAEVREITPVERALLAIARAVNGLKGEAEGLAGKLLVLDEPTVFLPRKDVDRLFDLVRRIVAQDASVLFVSHDIEEVFEVTNTVSVLRDGVVAGVHPTAEVTKSQLVELIIGRTLTMETRTHEVRDGQATVLSVDGASGKAVSHASFELRSGEVLGVTGLVGSGFDELPYLVYGARKASGGTITMDSRLYPLSNLVPEYSLRNGVVLIPGDRLNDGSAPSLTATDNMTMPTLRQYRRRGFLRRNRMHHDAKHLMDEFDVRPREPSQIYRFFSGGNQQKALLAKWLQLEPRVLLLHEPTQGVDIGAREQVFSLIRKAQSKGAAVLCASSDYEQLSMICDRVLIFGAGQIVDELVGAGTSKEIITNACLNSLSRKAEQEAI